VDAFCIGHQFEEVLVITHAVPRPATATGRLRLDIEGDFTTTDLQLYTPNDMGQAAAIIQAATSTCI
jgi:hypothetical protein